jgi:hypothetical protein
MRLERSREAIRKILIRDRNNVPQYSIWLYALRFLLIFSVSCAIGVLIVSNTRHVNQFNEGIRAYFSLFDLTDAFRWLGSMARASLFEVSLLMLSLLSALTYFCPAVIHGINLIAGVVYGICIEAVAECKAISDKLTLVYALTVSCFAILLALWSSELLRLNHACIAKAPSKSSHSLIYVSPIIGNLLKSSAFAFLIFATFRFTASLIMTVAVMLSQYQ